MSTTNYFDVYRCEPELAVTIPQHTDDEPHIIMAIAVAGGGRVGRSYASADWIYTVRADGDVIISGADIRSNLAPATHDDMVNSLANFLESEGQRLYRDSLGYTVKDIDWVKARYHESAQEFLIQNYERFTVRARRNRQTASDPG